VGRGMNAPTALASRETCQALAACSRCKTRERAPHQRYCRPCHADYMREHNARSKRSRRELEQALEAIASGEVNLIGEARALALFALIDARLR
jgi:hypothetical protein